MDRPSLEASLMDVKSLREEALAETTRFFQDSQGFLPDPDSDEWEDEYRRRFELAKKRHATKQSAAPPRVAPIAPTDEPQDKWPELSGPSAQKRWAATVRADRLEEIQSKDLRGWLAGAWTSSKDWIGTRDLSAPMFLHRVEAQYADRRRQSEKQASARQAERHTKAVAVETLRHQVQAAGITAEGLVGLVDVSPRIKAAAIKGKLAEINAAGRSLRVFETGNPAALMVIETGEAGRAEYAIERDDGLVADLKLFAQSELG
jgi:hypothetical protein